MKHRFYTEGPLDLLENQEMHHLVHVLRIKEGEEIEVIDGKGHLAHAQVAAIEKKIVHLTLLETKTSPPPSHTVALGLPLMRMEHLEWAIEKGTELNASAFYLFCADRSEKKELSPHQWERLRHITISATKQCQRLFLPPIQPVPSLSELLTTDALICFGDLRPQKSSPPPSNKILFISGPEQGFSNQELKLLEQSAIGINLSDNVLRAETAPIAALSILCKKFL